MNDLVVIIVVLGASALAIGLLVALNAFLGGWTASRLASLEAAAQRIRVDVIDFEPGDDGVLDADKSAALVMDAAARRVGLAVCLGDCVAVRALRPGDIAGVSVSGVELDLRLDDYTLPKVVLRLGSPELATRWEGVLAGFAPHDGSDAAHA